MSPPRDLRPRLEEALQAGLIASPNQIEAVKANLQKREPNFDDPE